MKKYKEITGIVTSKDEPIEYARKDGSGYVLVCNFYIGYLRFSCFSDILFDNFAVGKRTNFEYSEEEDGRFTNRNVIRICDDKIVELKLETIKRLGFSKEEMKKIGICEKNKK